MALPVLWECGIPRGMDQLSGAAFGFPALAWTYMYTERDHGQGWAEGLQEDLPLPSLINLDAFSQDTEQGGAL